MIHIESEIGRIVFPSYVAELYGRPWELVGYCVYQQGRLVYREAHPLDNRSIRLDVTVERGVSKSEAEQHIRKAVAQYLKGLAGGQGGLSAFKTTLERWELQSLVEDEASVAGTIVHSQSFDPMIGYSAFTRGLMMTSRGEALVRSDVESGKVSLFRYEPLPESEGHADFLGHLYFGRHSDALMVEDALLRQGHWILPHLANLQDVQIEISGERRPKAKAPGLLSSCRVLLCDSFTMSKDGDKTITLSDFPLRTQLRGRDTLLVTPKAAGDPESIALQFLSVDDLDSEDLQCFNDNVSVIDEWLTRVEKADRLFTVIK